MDVKTVAAWTKGVFDRVLDYGAFWRVLQSELVRVVPGVDTVLFAEVVDHVIPQVLRSTDGVYEQMEAGRVSAMVLSSPLHAFLKSNPWQRVVPWEAYMGTEARLLADPHYQEFLAPFGWRYFLTLCFYRRRQIAAVVILARSRAAGEFSEAERRKVDALHGIIDPVLDRCSAHYRIERERRALRRWSEGLEVPALLLDWELNLVSASDTAREACLRWEHGIERAAGYNKRSRFLLPDALLTGARRLKKRCYKALEGYQSPAELPSMEERIASAALPGATAMIRVVRSAGKRLALPHLQVHFTECGGAVAAACADDVVWADRLAELTPKERRVLTYLEQGLCNAEIATATGRALGTVKNQISSVYAKLGVKNRSQLLARQPLR